MGVFALILLAGAVFGGPVLGSAQPAYADVDDFTFESMTADYTLSTADDGTSRLHVVETFVAVFPETDQNRGMRRVIPDRYNGQPLNPTLISITDERGASRPSEVDTDGDYAMTSRATGYVHGAQTYVFTYTLEHVVWDFPDTGLEFYWDVNGVDWAQPFGQITARLHLDASLADELTGNLACYQGSQGAETPCADIAQTSDAAGVVVTARAEQVAPGETLTMAVGLDDDAFEAFDTSFAASGWSWLQTGALALSAGAVGTAVWTRRRFLRDAPGRPTIIAEYTPPRGVDALESAVLLGKRAKGIPAEVLEQAVVGSIRILEGEKTWYGRVPLVAELVDATRADANGQILLRGLFGGGGPGTRFTFGRQDRGLSRAAQSILADASKDLRERGFVRPVSAWAYARAPFFAFVALAGVVVAGILAMESGVSSALPGVLIGVAVVATIAAIIVIAKQPLTAAGAEVRDHLAGLREFIEWAEADRIRMLQSPGGAERVGVDVSSPTQMLKLYEPLLPYAVVFGQEKEWSQLLSQLYTNTGAVGPVWYVGAAGFNASSFASGIGSLSAAASASSSTSGGSGGGGGAGGGGGGGGGGGV